MAGRKRKIPEGYIPQWSGHSESSDLSGNESDTHAKRFLTNSSSQTPAPSAVDVSSPHLAPAPLDEVDSYEEEENADEGNPQYHHQVQFDPEDMVEVPEHHQLQQQHQLCQAHFLEQHEVPQQHQLPQPRQFHEHQYIEQQYTNMDEEEEDEEEVVEELEEDQEEDYTQNNWYYAYNENSEENTPNSPIPQEVDQHADGEEEEEDEVWRETEDPQEDKEAYEYVLKQFSEEWIMNESFHKVSKVASSEFWNISRKWMFALTSSFMKEKKKKFPKFAHIRRKLKKNNVPRISLDTGYLHKNSNNITVAKDTEKIPVLEFPPDEYQKVFEIATIKV